jgi:thymidylate synthase
MIIYTRPTMHSDFKEDGKNDFLCTTWNQFLIRDNKLYMYYVMRSNDSYFGTINNIPWAMYVYNDMYNKLLETYP